MTRIQIPAYTNCWKIGNRTGDLLAIETKINGGRQTEIAHIKLDKSGNTVRVILADCEIL